jgi:uncharacterized membrane protein
MKFIILKSLLVPSHLVHLKHKYFLQHQHITLPEILKEKVVELGKYEYIFLIHVIYVFNYRCLMKTMIAVAVGGFHHPVGASAVLHNSSCPLQSRMSRTCTGSTLKTA